MDLCKNRSQQRLCAKIVGAVIFVIAIAWIIISLRETPEEVKTCEPTITVRKMGQFGNQIWEYMSLYVIWNVQYDILKNFDFTPYIDEDMKENLEDLFENLTIQAFPKIYRQCDDRETITILKDQQFRLPQNMYKRNILLDSYSARYEDVVEYGIENVKKELRFKSKYVEDVMKTFEKIRSEHHLQSNDTVFVGMHYRGGDYIPHLEGNHGTKFKGPPNYSYYTSAMDYFKAKYNNVIFIMVSIDGDWLAKNVAKIQKHGTVILNPYTNDVNRDLTLLSHCNHSIINYGTFGVTAALFAQGDTILYDLELPIDYRGDTLALGLSKILPSWIPMKNTHEDDAVGYSL
ncbi:hypothetical protein AMK59_6377 [Oryctes borbonicus]|uniref:L-Fucosyltransferase n=1 Tax=Oryctes borbonicus TaxID=1629725 RepID=A0A0T6AY51_9SCAR|nr:hypothetical protein AMK59_6377 [Oryctes borbonicus]